MADELLVSIPEAARRLAIARSHLYQHLNRGTIASVRIGRARRIALTELEAFVERLVEDSANARSWPMPSNTRC